MQLRQLFSVLVKVLGVWEFVHGLQYVPLMFGQFYQWSNESEFAMMILSSAFGGAGIRLITGAVLFFSADWLAHKAYPNRAIEELA